MLPGSKIWRHLWLARSAVGCLRCSSARGCKSCGSSRTFPLRLFPHPSPTSIGLIFILGSATPRRQLLYNIIPAERRSSRRNVGQSTYSGTRIDPSIAAILRHRIQSTLAPLLPSLPLSMSKHTRSVYHIRSEEFEAQEQQVQGHCGDFAPLHERPSI